MGYSLLEVQDDPLEGKILVAAGEGRKGGAYIARITGPDSKYKYARQFLGSTEWSRESKGVKIVKVPFEELEEEDILEIRSGGSWKNDYRHFYLFRKEDESIREIDEKELRTKLAEKLKAKRGN